MRRVVASIGVLTAERVLHLVSGAAVSIVVARSLGRDQFAIYVFVFASVALLGPLLDVGQTILVRDLVTRPERRAEQLASAFRVALLIAVSLQVVALGFVAFLPADLAAARVPILVASFGLLIRPFFVLDYWFQSRLDARAPAGARLTGIALGSTLRVILALRGGPDVIFWLAATSVLEAGVSALLMIMQFRRRGESTRELVLGPAAPRMYFRRVFPLLIASLSIALYMRLDQVMLGLLAQKAEVANYAVTVRISELAYFLPVAISTSIMPGLSALFARDQEAFYRMYDRVVGGFFAASLVIVLGVLALSYPLIVLLFGVEYEGAVSVLRVHILSLPFVFLGVAQTAWNAVHEQQALAMWRTVGGAVINTVLNLILLPRFGALGAAYATVIAYAFAGVFGNAFSPRTRPVLAIQLRQVLPAHLARNVTALYREVTTSLASARQSKV